MDYYNRKRIAQKMIEKMYAQHLDDDWIVFQVAQMYQLGETFVLKYLKMLKTHKYVPAPEVPSSMDADTPGYPCNE